MENSIPFDVSGVTSGSKNGSRRYGFWLMLFMAHMALLRVCFASFAASGIWFVYSQIFTSKPFSLVDAFDFWFNGIAGAFLWMFGWLVRNRFWQRGREFPQLARKLVFLAACFCIANGVMSITRFFFDGGWRGYVLANWQYFIGTGIFFFVHLAILAGWRKNLTKLIKSGRGARVFHRNLETD